MMKAPRAILFAAVALTVATLGVWAATGRHAYTKFVVVERTEVAADPNDPFASAGFYDDSGPSRTIARDEFHLGLLPVPERLLDKHVLSVVSIAGVVWLLALPAAWLTRRHCCCCTTSKEIAS